MYVKMIWNFGFSNHKLPIENIFTENYTLPVELIDPGVTGSIANPGLCVVLLIHEMIFKGLYLEIFYGLF